MSSLEKLVPAQDGEPEKEPRQRAREMAYAHFRDDAGNPQLKLSSVLFWDLLGVSAMSSAPEPEAAEDLRRIRAAVGAARERANTEAPDYLRCSTWFTDNVVLASPVMLSQDDEVSIGPTFVDAAYMQLYLLREGFLARGAISFGLHYMDETFVFGPALIEAHKLEEDSGGRRWPCIAVTDEVAERCRAMAHYYDKPKQSPFARELKVDEQGNVFVDQLGIWLDEEADPRVLEYWAPRYRGLIRRKLTEIPRGSRLWDKWRWLGDYHDYTLRLRRQNRRHFVTGLSAQHKFTEFADTM